MANNILNVAIPDLERVDGVLEKRLGRSDLVITTTIQRVIDLLTLLYGRRSSKSHGHFSTKVDDYPTERFLRTYLAEVTAPAFADMTAHMMTTLETQARRKSNAGEGYVFFAHLENENGQFLLIAILNTKLGAALTQDLEPRDVEHLDIDGFRFAGRIGIDGWLANAQRYIGFLKGKGDVADYFREFLGCEESVMIKRDTSDLVTALKSYADGQEMPPAERDAFLARAKAICSRSAKDRTEISFSTLANELVPGEPQMLLDVLNDPGRRLNDGFVPDGRTLRSLTRFQAKTKLWSLEFEREAHRRCPEPDWPALHRELKRKHVTLQILWDEYITRHLDGYRYSRFCDLYRGWAAKLPVTMRQSHAAGDKLFVDYAGDTGGVCRRVHRPGAADAGPSHEPSDRGVEGVAIAQGVPALCVRERGAA